MRKKNEVPVVALVGYTNAGKSTVMNAMLELYQLKAEKQVFEKDMLFATLETSVRNIILPDHKSFLLTDTVGFISKLPHHLVKELNRSDELVNGIGYSLQSDETDNVTDNESTEIDKVFISAKKKVGLDRLTNLMKEYIFSNYICVEVLLPYNKGNVVSYLNDNTAVQATRYENDDIWISLECSQGDYEKIKQYEKKVITAN
ncbi:MAG: GTPase [Anaerocolumna sp.]